MLGLIMLAEQRIAKIFQRHLLLMTRVKLSYRVAPQRGLVALLWAFVQATRLNLFARRQKQHKPAILVSGRTTDAEPNGAQTLQAEQLQTKHAMHFSPVAKLMA